MHHKVTAVTSALCAADFPARAQSARHLLLLIRTDHHATLLRACIVLCGKGALSVEELPKVLEEHGVECDANRVRELFANYDVDKCERVRACTPLSLWVLAGRDAHSRPAFVADCSRSCRRNVS